MKSKENLLSLIEYCFNHPEERFWQAIRNWSRYYFIFAWRPKTPIRIDPDGSHHTENPSEEEIIRLGLEDTFYWK